MSAMIKILVGILIFTSVSCTGQSNSDKGKISKDVAREVVSDTILTLKLNLGYEVKQLNIGAKPSDIIRILKDGENIGELLLPASDIEVKNFAVNKIEETSSGFAISVNWGGGTSFYSRRFQFDFKEEEGAFYLERIEKSAYNSESEIQTSTFEKVTPPIKVDRIKLSKFITND